jgi:sugar/nucleoside kinase (ribokinase family)
MPIDLSTLRLSPEIKAQLADFGGLRTVVGGAAVAVGANAGIAGSITVTSTNEGSVTMTSGEAILTATAQSTDGSIPYATAYTYADAEGEDFLDSTTVTSTATDQSGDQTTLITTSRTFVFASATEENPFAGYRGDDSFVDASAAISGDDPSDLYKDDPDPSLEALVWTADHLPSVYAEMMIA